MLVSLNSINQCSSVVEQRTHIPYVASSNLAIGTRDWYSGIMTAFQADETGSIPVFRSRDNHRASKLYDKLSPRIGLACGDMQKVHRKGAAKRRDEAALDFHGSRDSPLPR